MELVHRNHLNETQWISRRRKIGDGRRPPAELPRPECGNRTGTTKTKNKLEQLWSYFLKKKQQDIFERKKWRKRRLVETGVTPARGAHVPVGISGTEFWNTATVATVLGSDRGRNLLPSFTEFFFVRLSRKSSSTPRPTRRLLCKNKKKEQKKKTWKRNTEIKGKK